jgi:hypothetical protein
MKPALKKGTRVRHLGKPEWGIGDVLEDSTPDAVRVFFVEGGERRLAIAQATLNIVTGLESRHPLLDNLKPAKAGEGIRFRSLAESIEEFLARYPGGFYGEVFSSKEREYKVDAHDLASEILSKAAFSRLLALNDWNECCKRALQVVNATNLIFPNEKMALKDSLRDTTSKRAFSEQLFALLHGKGAFEARFISFAALLQEFGAAKWTIATYFPFIMHPDEFMFLKPIATQNAADICRFELNYNSNVNWKTYHCLMVFSKHLRKELSRLKPRDYIDVQSFMWSISE